MFESALEAGLSAAGVDIRLYATARGRELVAGAVTNEDGRAPHPLLDGEAFVSGIYELEFDVGRYFRGRGIALPEPAFLDTVVIRFAVNADEDYHVPLLVAPWSYSTYRGS